MADLERRVDLAAPRRDRRAGAVEGLARPRARRPARRAGCRASTACASCWPCSKCTISFATRWPGCCRRRARGDPAGRERTDRRHRPGRDRRGCRRHRARCLQRQRVGARRTPGRAAHADDGWSGTIYMGGILNQDTGHACRSTPGPRSASSACTASTTPTNSCSCWLAAEHEPLCYVRDPCDSGRCSSTATSATIRRFSKTWRSRSKAPGSTRS